MAAELGFPTVRHMMATMTSREYTRWCAYFNVRLGLIKPKPSTDGLGRFWEAFFKAQAHVRE